LPQRRIIHPGTPPRRMPKLRKEQIMTDEQLDEIIKQIDLINARIKVISEILRVEDIVENANPDAG
jgi:hypothetical protein